MKPKLLLCLALVLSVVLTGCQTETVQKFQGIGTNLKGDGHTETNMPMSLTYYGGVKNGRTSTAFSLGDQRCWFLLYYPTNNLNQTLELQTESQQIYAWLVRTQLDDQKFWSVYSPSVPPFPNSEQLHGNVAISQYDWRHKNLFHISMDVIGDDGAVIKGEFISYTKTKFDAKQLWLDPYLIIFGPFVNW